MVSLTSMKILKWAIPVGLVDNLQLPLDTANVSIPPINCDKCLFIHKTLQQSSWATFDKAI